MNELLIFPAAIRDPDDYSEVLRALARHAGLEAYAHARRDADGWVVVLETRGRLQRGRHVDDGVVALDVVGPMVNRALQDAGDERRMAGFLASDWGEEGGAVVCLPEALDDWRARGEVTVLDASPDEAEAPPGPQGPTLDAAVSELGDRLHIKETVD